MTEPAPAARVGCPWCSGVCAGVDLAALTSPRLSWLWTALAAAGDRRGDPDLTSGPAVTVTVPADAGERAAAAGLLPGRPLLGGQRRQVDLAALTVVLAARSLALTPGAVAAHAVGRPLAVQARARRERQLDIETVAGRLAAEARQLPAHVLVRAGDLEQLPVRLRKAGWFARLLREADPDALLTRVLAVAARLPEPGDRVDRRTLVPADPHALDGGPLPSLVLALVGESDRGRRGWANVGVDCDELLGGLIVSGVLPAGWRVPAGVTVTIPPRELAGIQWQSPPVEGAWVFVTENPSVLTAAAQAMPALAGPDGREPVSPVVCTAGTPSATECEAIGKLTAAGWQVAVRADFDQAGLAHMRAMLDKAPTARPWRMSVSDYLLSVQQVQEAIFEKPADTTPTDDGQGHSQPDNGESQSPWSRPLAAAIATHGAIFEEELLPQLLADIATGHPPVPFVSAAMP